MVCGRGASNGDIHIHSLIDTTNLPNILPTVHALTGCDSTSKVATSLTALKVASTEKRHLLTDFAKVPFSDVMVINAEHFMYNQIGVTTIHLYIGKFEATKNVFSDIGVAPISS